MSRKKHREDSFNFFNPRWHEAVPGMAAVWTHRDNPWFSGPYEPIANMRLWLVRSIEGRPIMGCFRPRVDPSVAVATVDRDAMVGAWDLSAREGKGSLPPEPDTLACAVRDIFISQWPKAAVGQFPVPAAYVGYANRIRVRRTPEFASRLPDGASAAEFAAAWADVPSRVGGEKGLYFYPAKFVSGDGPLLDVHPETLDPRPAAGVATAPGWVRRGDDWVPAAPAGRGIMHADVSRIAGVEVPNPARQVYKEFGLLESGVGRDDRAALDAAARRLNDPAEFAPKDRLTLCSAMWLRLARRTKFTPGDLLDGLLNPHRPLVASTYPRVTSFPVAALGEAAGRGWEFKLAVDAAPVEPAATAAMAAAI